MEHTGGAPRRQRLLGNERFRKIKIEVGNQHYLDYICRTLLRRERLVVSTPECDRRKSESTLKCLSRMKTVFDARFAASATCCTTMVMLPRVMEISPSACART